MFKPALTTALLLLAASGALAQVYKWVDENGVTHYSDQPQPGAERIDLPKPPSTTAATPPAPRSSGLPGAARSEPEPEPSRPFSYESISFASPAAEETLWNIGGILSVSLNIQPGLQDGHRVRVYFDGELTEASGQQFQLQEVWRGAHNLQAEVVDATGQLMIRSEPIRFYVQQTSIAN